MFGSVAARVALPLPPAQVHNRGSAPADTTLASAAAPVSDIGADGGDGGAGTLGQVNVGISAY